MRAPEYVSGPDVSNEGEVSFEFLDAGGPETRLGRRHGDPIYARLTVRFSEDGSVVGIELESAEPLTPSELQRFPWSKWLTACDAAFRSEGHAGPETVWDAMGAPRRPKRPGRRGHAEDHYRKVADRYLELRGEGDPAPVDTIAAEWKYNRNTVAGWVRKCRQLDYLPPARRGRAG